MQKACLEAVALYFISGLLDDIGPRLLGLVLVPAHHVDRSACDVEARRESEHVEHAFYFTAVCITCVSGG